MKALWWRILLVLLSCLMVDGTRSRHLIYWDSSITPLLETGLSIHVKINDWMDISCPRYQPEEGGRQFRHDGRLLLQIYNVTKDDYDKCVTKHTDRVLLCQNPEKEAKLTTKFQRISPSPLGFVFRPGETYYYISRPIHSKSRGCTKNVMKLKVHVAAKKSGHGKGQEEYRTYHVIEHSRKSISTTTIFPVKQRKSAFDLLKSSKNEHLRMPVFHTIEDDIKEETEQNHKASKVVQNKGNSADTIKCPTVLLFIVLTYVLKFINAFSLR